MVKLNIYKLYLGCWDFLTDLSNLRIPTVAFQDVVVKSFVYQLPVLLISETWCIKGLTVEQNITTKHYKFIRQFFR